MIKNDIKNIADLMPMTKFLFTYIKKTKKYNEKAEFKFDDWL